MTTLEDTSIFEVETFAEMATRDEARADDSRKWRDGLIRSCYSAGNATLQQLANATGLSKARIQQIVKDGEA